MKKLILAFVCLFLAVPCQAVQVIYVDGDAPGPTHDGSSWADAYNYLQDALAAASSGDEIRVAQGIYNPDQGGSKTPGDREATFQLINGVAIKGGFAGFGEADPNKRHIGTYKTILSGDIGGNDINDIDVLNPCDLLDHPSRAENSYHVANGSGTDATTIMDGLIITGGNANFMYFPGQFDRPHDVGGGMYNKCGSPTLINCIFVMNSARYGGGMENTADNPTWPFPQPSLCDPGTPTLINCTFIRNSAYYGGGMIQYLSIPTLTNCILWGNFAPHGPQIYGLATVTYSDVQGGWPGEGNIDADPCFVDSNNNDYHLLPDSPCIDAGDPNYVPEPNETDLYGKPRVIGGRIDMGAYEYRPLIPAEARIIPRTINLASKGKWITAFLWLPEDYNVADIDPNSVFLEEQIKGEQLLVNEQEQFVMARFNRSDVQDILDIGQVELTITGELIDGTVFEATDIIRVLNKSGRKSAK